MSNRNKRFLNFYLLKNTLLQKQKQKKKLYFICCTCSKLFKGNTFKSHAVVAKLNLLALN